MFNAVFIQGSFFVLLGAILFFGILGFAYAFGTNNPSVFGHTASEVNPGTFGGISGSDWILNGKLAVSKPDVAGTYNGGALQSKLDVGGVIAADDLWLKTPGNKLLSMDLNNKLTSCSLECVQSGSASCPSVTPPYVQTGPGIDSFDRRTCCRVVCVKT